jgi:hypothetical protein
MNSFTLFCLAFKKHFNIMMKRLLFIVFTLVTVTVFAQEKKQKKDWSKIDLTNRANDHFMIQFGADSWMNKPDTIRTKGFSKFLNIYFMTDKPFKNNPRYSVGIGVGIGSSNIMLDKMQLDLKAVATKALFARADSIDHYKKHKLTTVYLELPVELRFKTNPENSSKGWKAAIGVKVGTLLSAHTKGKGLEDKNNQLINNSIVKEKDKKFINPTRLALTARVGTGIFSLFASYQITSVFKESAGPQVRPLSIGVTLSGL